MNAAAANYSWCTKEQKLRFGESYYLVGSLSVDSVPVFRPALASSPKYSAPLPGAGVRSWLGSGLAHQVVAVGEQEVVAQLHLREASALLRIAKAQLPTLAQAGGATTTAFEFPPVAIAPETAAASAHATPRPPRRATRGRRSPLGPDQWSSFFYLP